MHCPKCGKFSKNLGAMEVTTFDGNNLMTKVFQCRRCTQILPYPEGALWPLEFVMVGKHSEIVRATGYD